MKKRLLTLAIAALLGAVTQAQISTFPYLQDFENGMGGWTVLDADHDNNNWFIEAVTSSEAHSGTHLIKSESYSSTTYNALTPNNWLISPAISLGSDVMQLTWYDSPYSVTYYAEHYAVYVSTGGNDTASFLASAPVFDTTLSAEQWVKRTVSLAAYTGQTIYIAFRHFNCTDMDALQIDDIAIGVQPSCDGPENIALSNLTSSEATVTWSASDNFTNVEVFLNNTSLGIHSDTSYTFTGLTPATAYSVRIVGQCATGGISESASLSFSTPCVAITELPYFEGFENGNALCWNYDNNDWAIIFSEQDNPSSHSGNYYMRGTEVGSYMLTPSFTIPDNAEGLNAEFYAQGANSAAMNFKVHIATTGATAFDSALFTTILDTTVSTVYSKISIPLSAYAGQTITLAFEKVTPSAFWYYTMLYIDDFSVRSGAMPAVTLNGPTVADLGSTATFIAQLTSGDTNNVNYTWTSARVAAGDATMADNGNTMSVTYTAGTTDTVTVNADNGFGTATATVYVHLRDCQAIDSMPWLEDFNNTMAIECWTVIDNDNDGNTWGVTSGVVSARYCSATASDWLITPAITIPADAEGLVLAWNVRGTQYDGNNSDDFSYKVMLSSDASTTTSGFDTELLTFSGALPTFATHTVSIEQYAGQTVRFAFVHDGADDWGIALDSVCIRLSQAPRITAPALVFASINIPQTITATLNEGSSDGLNYTWSSLMVDAGNAVANATDNSYTVTYSSLGVDTIKVMAQNVYGQDSAVIVVNVRDLSPISTLPYNTGFEAGEDTNWLFANNDNGWHIDTAVANGGARSLYISNDTGANNAYTISVPSASYATRYIMLPQAGDYSFSFDWKCVGEANWDFARAFLAPASVEFTSGNSAGINYSSLSLPYIALDGGNQLSANSLWQTVTTEFTVAQPGMYQIVFYWRNDALMGNQPPIAIDNVSLSQTTCMKPTQFTVDSVSSNSITIHWTPRGEEENWEVVVSDTVSLVVVDTVFTAENLDGNTVYRFSIRAVCGEGDTSVAITGSARTECGDIQLPYIETFNTDDGFNCWSTIDADNDGETWIVSYGELLSMNESYYGSTPVDNWAIMPAVTIPEDADGYNLIWDIAASEAYLGTLTPKYEVRLSPTAGNTAASFTDTLFTESFASDDYVHRSVSLDGYAGQTVRIAFRHVNSSNDGSIYIDNVAIREANLPVIELNGPVTAIVGDEKTYVATLVEGSTNGLTYTWNSQLETVNETSDTLNITYTNAGTDIITVIATNSYGSDTAKIAVNVIACNSISSFPYVEGFEGGNIECWTTLDMNNDDSDDWQLLNSLFSYSGNYCMYSDYNFEINSNDWLISPAIEIPADADFVFSWWGKNQSYENYTDDYTVLVSTTGTNIADFTDTLATVMYDNNWAQHSVSIADYAGETIRIAFHHTGMNGYGVYIDELYIGQGDDTTQHGDTVLTCDTPVISRTSSTDNTVTMVFTSEAQLFAVAIMTGAWAEPTVADTISANSHVFTGLTAGTQYTVAVRALCSDDMVSDWAHASVSTTNGGNGIDAAMSVNFGLYPNPASMSATIELDGTAEVSILDLSGRTEDRWSNVSGKLTVDLSSYARGAYFVRVTTAEGTAVRKLIVQ